LNHNHFHSISPFFLYTYNNATKILLFFFYPEKKYRGYFCVLDGIE